MLSARPQLISEYLENINQMALTHCEYLQLLVSLSVQDISVYPEIHGIYIKQIISGGINHQLSAFIESAFKIEAVVPSKRNLDGEYGEKIIIGGCYKLKNTEAWNGFLFDFANTKHLRQWLTSSKEEAIKWVLNSSIELGELRNKINREYSALEQLAECDDEQ